MKEKKCSVHSNRTLPKGSEKAHNLILPKEKLFVQGGNPSPACENVMSTLEISPNGIPSNFKLNPKVFLSII